MVVAETNVVNGDSESHSKKIINGKPIKSKNQLRRLKQKQKKQSVSSYSSRTCEFANSYFVEQDQQDGAVNGSSNGDDMKMEEDERPANVEYVSEQLDLSDAGLEAFSDVFARFQLPPEESSVRVMCLSLSLMPTYVLPGKIL